MASFPLVSIITVSYNSAATIQRTIESVLHQTDNNIEYIIIDGGSTDRTVEIIEKFEPQFKAIGIKFCWVSEPDKGIYDAMNKGILMAEGQWINIQGSDDWLEIDAVETFRAYLNKNSSADIFWFGANIHLDDHILISKPDVGKLKRFKLVGCHQAAFVSQHLMKPGFNLIYKLAADYELILKLYLRGAIIKCFDPIIANYTLGGASNINQFKTVKEYQQISLSLQKNKQFEINIYFRILKLRLAITQRLKKVLSNKIYIWIKKGKSS